MRGRGPTLGELRALDVVARHLSFTRAAAVLATIHEPADLLADPLLQHAPAVEMFRDWLAGEARAPGGLVAARQRQGSM